MSAAGDLRADLTAMFADVGNAIVLQRIIPGAYDKTTGVAALGTNLYYPGIGRLGSYSDFATDGTMIIESDRRVTFIPNDLTFVPTTGDRLYSGTDVYSVVNSKKREMNGELISWTIQVRR